MSDPRSLQGKSEMPLAGNVPSTLLSKGKLLRDDEPYGAGEVIFTWADDKPARVKRSASVAELDNILKDL